MSSFSFEIVETLHGTRARAGELSTARGTIKTPAFIAVGTKATVKGLSTETLSRIGVQAVLGNTYHLYLEPGEKVVAEAGGIGSFMNWSGPTFTDSGGFQVFSLGAGFGKGINKFERDVDADEALVPYNKELAQSHGKLAIIDEDGVSFTSHLDGSLHRFTPERSMEIQHALGADIIFAFDECTSPTADEAYQKEAMERTHRWAKRSLLSHKRNIDSARRQALFGIVQGGRFAHLREESAKVIAGMDFDGFGIGGSFSKKDLDASLARVNTILPMEKPRHLLGIGSEPRDLFDGVEHGIDTFDCVAPTRLARTGTLYTARGEIHILNARYRTDHTLLDEETGSEVGKTYSKAYLAHLFRSREMLGAVLASEHNLFFMMQLLARIRASLLDGTFREYRQEFLTKYYGKA
ncbi:tRNA guanosine(34) transglycosylase Tgt [Candidatus Kaiserbacteria bacterium CG10_big_fil_rev_8_21_14_0_10_49_17]|uniref:Queuine tRNA-ribosyltransferase n=1 Tax=Candidatus Kaiserbacteria bacterium CG10_big_fil_rev_8_21_14_0_10_49_17 TaxID=1974609 RepID=A0A2M6WFA2_9BACT|nr:MAG: tRNA guanosine(34) transglycosylase Tgt [Candidatus Kaiserbacteria bacterium CG10_big_fil_rev_8_21_14_0_10_49_17]